MGLETVGDVGKDSNIRIDNTDGGMGPHGGGSPIDTVGDVGKDDQKFSDNTMNHQSTGRMPKPGKSIQSPGDIQM